MLSIKAVFKYPPQIEAIDPKEKNKPVEIKEQNNSHQADQKEFDSELPEKEPLDTEKPLDGEEIKTEEVVPSTVGIAIDNADQLRSIDQDFGS